MNETEGESPNIEPVAEEPKQPAQLMDKSQARLSGYTGDVCSNCGSVQMRRNGSCLVCEGCGTTTGCS